MASAPCGRETINVGFAFSTKSQNMLPKAGMLGGGGELYTYIYIYNLVRTTSFSHQKPGFQMSLIVRLHHLSSQHSIQLLHHFLSVSWLIYDKLATKTSLCLNEALEENVGSDTWKMVYFSKADRFTCDDLVSQKRRFPCLLCALQVDRQHYSLTVEGRAGRHPRARLYIH